MIEALKIDLACGDRKKEGYYGVDIANLPEVDCVWDLQQYPWPIESNSVEEIHCVHYIEHIPHTNYKLELSELLNNSTTFEEFKWKVQNSKPELDGLIKFLNEIYRILKPEGKVRLIAPYWANMRAVGDPTHCRLIADQTWLYVNKTWMDENRLSHYGLDCNFDVILSYLITNEMTLKSEEVRNKAFTHDINVIDDLIIDLVKK